MSIMNKLRGAARVVTGHAEAVEHGTGQHLADLAEQAQKTELELLRKTVEAMRADRDHQRRRGDEHFALVERVLAERDMWSSMFRIHSVEHNNAQFLLETALIRTREMLAKTITLVNAYRKRDNQPLLEEPKDIDAAAPPVGVAKAFKERMEALEKDPAEAIRGIVNPSARKLMHEETERPIDGIAERDKIEAQYAKDGSPRRP